jgi:hypothetical protein
MKFRVTDIEFDFEQDGEYPTAGYQEDLICDTLTAIWETESEDDLVEEITCATGWCIKSLDYEEV